MQLCSVPEIRSSRSLPGMLSARVATESERQTVLTGLYAEMLLSLVFQHAMQPIGLPSSTQSLDSKVAPEVTHLAELT